MAAVRALGEEVKALRWTMIIGAILLAGLGACQQPQPEASLELACQVKACSCIGARESIIGAPNVQEVLWKENGEAYCAEGYRLESAGSKSKDWLKNYGG